MISDICKIENGTKDLEAILKEGKKVAVYNELNEKQALQLSLICEELDGMLPNIVSEFDGDFWIEFDRGICKINASIKIPELNSNEKAELIKVAKNKKNAHAVGLVGKIRNAIENFFLNEEMIYSLDMSPALFHLATGYSEGADYSYVWRLNEYKDTVKETKKEEEWDELEKSIIASLADDVVVGVRGKQATVVIVKKFA